MEQPVATPKRSRGHRGPRNHNNNHNHSKNHNLQNQEPVMTDFVDTPNTKKNHHHHHHQQRTTSKDIPGSHTMPVSAEPQDITGTFEVLDLGTNVVPSTHKKKHRNRKKTTEKSQQPGPISIVQSPPPNGISALGTPPKATQLFAGPTFSASPAPSSLPLPRFFSRGMQSSSNVSIDGPHESSSESSSQSGADSPTMAKTQRVLSHPDSIRGPSPLDIFFNADKKEKELAFERAKSASPPNTAFASPELNALVSGNPQTPSSVADPNFARTQALKQLLLFPQAQRSPSAGMDSSASSPFLDIQQRPSPAGRSTSAGSTPTRFTMGSYDTPQGQRSFYDSPHLTTPPSSARPMQTRRPLPHHLRQELLSSLPLDHQPDISSQTAGYAPIIPQA